MAGVTSTGFVPETLDSLKAQLEADFRATFGASINLSPQARFGQLIGILAERLADLWSLEQSVYSSLDANAAGGVALDNLASLTGTTRKAATYSTATLTVTGTPGTVLTAGRVASTQVNRDRFDTLATVTLTSVSAWASSHAYALGARATNGGNVYQVTAAGASAGSGGPTGTGFVITDGAATWRYLGQGTAAADVTVQAEASGPRTVAAGTLSIIETPASGWYGANNVIDGVQGVALETDGALRARRLAELQGSGNGAVPAIRAHLLALTGVIAATVFENATDVTDGDGMPPHSLEAMVQGGADADIIAQLWASKPAGIATTGTTTSTLLDSQGTTRTVKWSRPGTLNIYVAVTVTKDPLVYPADGATQIVNALLAYGTAQRTGKDVVAAALVAQVFSVPGVLEASVFIGTSPSPATATTVPVSTRQLAVYDSGRISVNDSASGVP